MPVITPAYPSMCATHNVMKSTMQVIHNELQRGSDITEKIMNGKGQWKDLFTKHTFFTADYKYYLSVITASTSDEAHLPWSGYIESRVRHLVKLLEDHQSIALAHPFNKGYSRVHRCQNEAEVEKAKGGSLEHQAKDIATATTGHGLAVGSSKADVGTAEQKLDTDANVTMVYTTTHYIGLELHPGMYLVCPRLRILYAPNRYSLQGNRLPFSASSASACAPSCAAHLLICLGVKSLDLEVLVSRFRNEQCFIWDKYDRESNAITIIHTRK